MRRIAIALAFTLSVGSAQAAVINWSTSLAPENEVPPVMGSMGSGTASGTINTNTGLLTWMVEWTGLTSDVVGAHFHGPATTMENASVVVNIGTISGLMSPTSGSTTVTLPQAAELLGELWYINVHTVDISSGEIRGQVLPGSIAIPLPGSLPLLLGAGLIAGGILRRRA